jgi:predicted nuclease of predicted toxin-antitoxin system
MRFLVDAQLPPALARWLVAKGYFDTILPELLAALARGETLIEVT